MGVTVWQCASVQCDSMGVTCPLNSQISWVLDPDQLDSFLLVSDKEKVASGQKITLLKIFQPSVGHECSVRCMNECRCFPKCLSNEWITIICYTPPLPPPLLPRILLSCELAPWPPPSLTGIAATRPSTRFIHPPQPTINLLFSALKILMKMRWWHQRKWAIDISWKIVVEGGPILFY